MTTRKCQVEGCPNDCKEPNIYCGRCAGYEHEMSKAERRAMIRGYRLYTHVDADGVAHKVTIPED